MSSNSKPILSLTVPQKRPRSSSNPCLILSSPSSVSTTSNNSPSKRHKLAGSRSALPRLENVTDHFTHDSGNGSEEEKDKKGSDELEKFPDFDNLIDDDYSDQDLADEFEARGPIYHPISTHARTWPDGTPFFESEKYLSRPNNINTSTERRIKLKFKLKPNPIPSRTPSPPTHTTTTITASEPAPVQPPKKIKLIFKPTPTLRPAVTLPPKVTKITKRPQKPARKPAREPTRRSPRLKEAAKKAKAQEAKPVKPSPPLPPPSSHRRGPGDEGRSACVEEEGRRRGGKRVKRC